MDRTKWIWIFLAVVIVLIALKPLFGIYGDWLWFGGLGFVRVFWTMLVAKVGAGLGFGLIFLAMIGLNFYLAGRYRGRVALVVQEEMPPRPRMSRAGYVAVALLFALITGLIGLSKWDMILRYFYRESFDLADPILGRDIGFYVFSLPLYLFLQKWFLGTLFVTAIAVVWFYAEGGALEVQERRLIVAPSVIGHLSVLGGLLLLLIAWWVRLKIFGLLYSSRGVTFGASYTDVNVQLWAYRILVGVALVSAGLFFANLFARGLRLPAIGSILMVGAAVLVGFVPAALVQSFVVEPSELAKEKPFIGYTIDYTRRAYGLDRIGERAFAAAETLTRRDIEANEVTIRNIRIWDERPLIQTYSQIQEIRLYYDFGEVDVDRYVLGEGYRQVMLSARELAADQIPLQARTWVNERLKYTHGYGLALSPVNQVTEEGLPQLLVKDIPPVTVPSLKIARPEIYYGERTRSYVLVRTKTEEFDYPKGDVNRYTTYAGTGGVLIGSLFRRLAFTFKFWDLKILLTGYLTPESRILFNRTIDQRRHAIAPFLRYDADPYLVISEGRLYWIQDAYTTTSMYPYSERLRGRTGRINYIRNSVKVVIDAYNGDLSFYVIDETDPLIRSYRRIFPGLFRPFSEMPPGLKAHVRYPRDLFKIQAYMYRSYHMRDVQVFYNQEDLWAIPNEMYSDNIQPLRT